MFYKSRVEIYDPKSKSWKWFTVRIDIDGHELAKHLAKKAAANKSRKSKIQGGLIVAEIKED